MTVKLAEALILRADLQKRLAQLRERLNVNAKVQEGTAAAEDPAALLAEVEELAGDLVRLIQNINRTNSTTNLDDDLTLSDALAERDMLASKQGTYRSLLQAATISQSVYSRSEVRWISTVDVAEVRRRADDYARQHRELDSRIQELNWATDLIER